MADPDIIGVIGNDGRWHYATEEVVSGVRGAPGGSMTPDKFVQDAQQAAIEEMEARPDATTPEQPRTAAGRALYKEIDESGWLVAGPGLASAIKSIEAEAQARPAGASEGLRAALERLPLASAEVNGLDVERLARALHEWMGCERRYQRLHKMGLNVSRDLNDHNADAEAIAAAYDAERQGEQK